MHGTLLQGEGVIHFAYVINGEISGNDIENATGIQLWGGDSHPTREGELHQERKCRGIIVSNNRVRRCSIGIFASNLRESTLCDNHASDCTNFGIGLAGCFDVTVAGNTLRDCANGCFVTFSYRCASSTTP